MTPRLAKLLIGASAALVGTAICLFADDAHTSAAAGPTSPPTVESLVDKAASDQADGKPDLAVQDASAALALDPKNAAALDLRGSSYIEEKLWGRAERDYTLLNQISPDPAYQYRLAKIKYVQREFEEARPLFAALKDDPRLGDLARFNVFACDYYGWHEEIAARDLALLDTTGQKPSFYYGRAAWAASHGQDALAGRLAAEADGKFDKNLLDLYTESFDIRHFFHPAEASFTTKDGRTFDDSRVVVENDGLHATTAQGWVTVPLDQLPDDLSPFPEEVREQIARNKSLDIAPPVIASPVTFTTKSGKTYRQVRWALEDTELLVLTPAGWATVPFSDLPVDLSCFPSDVRAQITQGRQGATESLKSFRIVSFVTRQGKQFENVRAWLEDEGVVAMTPDGPVTIPFTDLPDNTSAFPESWRSQIAQGRKLVAGTADPSAIVTFTTRSGKQYQGVRASVGSEGLMVATPEGWTTIALADLPTDLSAFPPTWRPLIQGWLKASSDDASGIQIVSFATRHGKHYDQVRASLDEKGLEVLGPDGWVEVTYDQLPADLTPFPAAWRPTISNRQKATEKNPAAYYPSQAN